MNPYPAGRAVHPDLAGEIPKKTFSCGPEISGGTQEVKLQFRQLTNRRMRTFIATPSARNVNNTEDPPYLINGKGIPVTGINPMTIPMLTAIWKVNTATT